MHVVKKWAQSTHEEENVLVNGIANNTEASDENSNQLVEVMIKLSSNY